MSDLKKKIQKLVREEMQFDGPERPDREIQRKVEKGETPFSDNPAIPGMEDDDNSFIEKVASDRFKQVVDNVKRYTGIEDLTRDGVMEQLQNMLARAIPQVKSIENVPENKERLEYLAIETIKNSLKIPDGQFNYDVELQTGMNQIDTSKMLSEPEDVDDEEVQQIFGFDMDEDDEDDLESFIQSFETFDTEQHKRRLINSLIQGAAKKGHFMYLMVENELNQIDPNLIRLYGILMSINDLLYWVVPDQVTMGEAASKQGVQGSSEIDPKTDPPTLVAKGLFFPVLLHELYKGAFEVFGTQGLPDDPRAAEMVMGQTDTLPNEVWDLRLGPVIWEKFRESYPDKLFEDDKIELQNYFFARFSALSTDEFMNLAKLILSGSQEGKKMVAEMVEEIIEELRQNDYEDSMSQFSNDDDDDDFDIDDIDLSDLGL